MPFRRSSTSGVFFRLPCRPAYHVLELLVTSVHEGLDGQVGVRSRTTALVEDRTVLLRARDEQTVFGSYRFGTGERKESQNRLFTPIARCIRAESARDYRVAPLQHSCFDIERHAGQTYRISAERARKLFGEMLLPRVSKYDGHGSMVLLEQLGKRDEAGDRPALTRIAGPKVKCDQLRFLSARKNALCGSPRIF